MDVMEKVQSSMMERLLIGLCGWIMITQVDYIKGKEIWVLERGKYVELSFVYTKLSLDLIDCPLGWKCLADI